MDFYEMTINEMTGAKFGKGEPQAKNNNVSWFLNIMCI